MQEICKWCRTPLLDVDGAWVRADGTYTCMPRSENLAEPADRRWEKMYATIGPCPISERDIETGWDKTLEKLIKFYVVVIYKDQRIYSTQLVDQKELQFANFDLYSWTLDQMVKHVDEFLDMVDRGEIPDG